MIPKIIHFVWIGGELPEWARLNIAEFERLNPDHEIMIHGREVLLDSLVDVYDRTSELASKADLLRLSALATYGGIYWDVDFWPFRPVSEIVTAYRLDGAKLFAAKQQGNTNAKMRYSNGVLASGTDTQALLDLIELAARTEPTGRTTYGPELVAKMVAANPAAFTIAEPGWFFPIDTNESSHVYPHLMAGHVGNLATRGGTGGQLPFAAHLWAHGRADKLAEAVDASPDVRPVAAILNASRPDHALHAIAAGLEATGFRVVRPSKTNELDMLFVPPAVMAVWNGRKDTAFVDYANRIGTPVIRIEHGFYKRQDYSQADHEGVLHWTSWRRDIRLPAPPEGEERLADFYPDGLEPMGLRAGHILVLGQCPGDSQLDESEITGPIPLQRFVKDALPDGAVAYFRPHPHASKTTPNPMHRTLPQLKLGAVKDEAVEYCKTKQGPGLAAALDRAAFVITINSNAIVEALAAGVPVLAFGPNLGIDAGVVKRTTIATLKDDIQTMLAGWCPRTDDVRNYLEWLAARQYSNAELADPTYVAALLESAGVEIPEQVNA